MLETDAPTQVAEPRPQLDPQHLEALPEKLYLASSHETGDSSGVDRPWAIAEAVPSNFSHNGLVAIYQRVGWLRITQVHKVTVQAVDPESPPEPTGT